MTKKQKCPTKRKICDIWVFYFLELFVSHNDYKMSNNYQ